MERNKIKSIIGFGLRARKVRIGENSIEMIKGNIFLLIYNDTISEGQLKRLKKIVKEKSSCLVKSNLPLIDLVNRECKVVGIIDKMFADNIIKEIKQDVTNKDYVIERVS